MSKVRNILFIMCDQLRWDYLSCMGHPTLETPHIDALAAKGVNFTRAYVQSPVCGPSRMSTLTGRYTFSHGSTWNGVPLSVGERTMGDYLRPLGLRTALVGKTHMEADLEGMKRLGISPDSDLGILASECGFEPYERDDGLWPDQMVDPHLAYNEYLWSKGYDGDNPWHDWANSAEGPDGEILSGWYLRNNHLPARVKEEDSETPYMTRRAMQFMEEAADTPWCLHLSLIKPHWPYIAPAPYHDMYGRNQILPSSKSDRERENPHPVHAAHMKHIESENFSDDEKRANVVPAYMGLIKQIDECMGTLFAWMDERGLMDNTMIVFTSDHGDYLGDHWLGEKELFHECSARVPMIVYDPDPAADSTRGARDDRLVEAIDLLPTFVDAAGGDAADLGHVLDGRSLMPLLRGGKADEWRDLAVSEIDYAFKTVRLTLGIEPAQSHAVMLFDGRYKYIHYEGFRPQLFDLESDPEEFVDLGEDPAFEQVRADMHERLFDWMRQRRQRMTLSEKQVSQRTDGATKRGIIIGHW